MPIPMHIQPASILRSQTPFTAQDSLCEHDHNIRATTPRLCNESNSPPAFSFGSTVTLDPADLAATPDPVAVAEIKRAFPPYFPMCHSDLWAMIVAPSTGVMEPAIIDQEYQAQVEEELLERYRGEFYEQNDNETGSEFDWAPIKAEFEKMSGDAFDLKLGDEMRAGFDWSPIKEQFENVSEAVSDLKMEDETGAEFDEFFKRLEESGL
ncbi:hypothetical protein A1O3_07425 [Capronia epimyces CBS 606.96]|uniref:Uncharacterized protein n=1 Tax=Capronia epimyces CBS 606.96 TaxID=1182542 RepID=W9XKT1_9EURO|nr:uncharacterized protein A1O3_07425 [Capronia epimyces CBS 606.96]EXJ81137.1 hypothetical protein A1O3_07425 [Capronia epimyces CBS 606.96]